MSKPKIASWIKCQLISTPTQLNLDSISNKLQLKLISISASNQPQRQYQPQLNLNLNSIWLWHKSNPILCWIINSQLSSYIYMLLVILVRWQVANYWKMIDFLYTNFIFKCLLVLFGENIFHSSNHFTFKICWSGAKINWQCGWSNIKDWTKLVLYPTWDRVWKSGWSNT